MKKIIVGRGLDCDIVIPDERDNVSRHHLVISFNLLGKMTISDTSSNGTFINEKKMLKGTSIPVTRNDKIRLGDRWGLDWSLVKDPYAAMRRQLLAAVALLIVAVAAVTWYVWKSSAATKEQGATAPKEYAEHNGGEWNKDSTNKVAPTEVSIPLGTKASKASVQSTSGRRSHKKTRSGKAVKNKTTSKQADTQTKTSTAPLPVIN